MDSDFRLFPQRASTLADEVDALYYFLITVSAFFTLLICVAILYFATKYRRGSKADRTVRRFNPLGLELLWTGVPLLLTMVMFFWGAYVYFQQRQAPADTMDIYVVGKQWMWKFQHPTGKREINQLHVPLGRAVRLIMASEDVIHSFYVPAFRTKMDVLPGRYSTVWFQATRTGTYHLFCAEYCGTGHARMTGRIVVVTPSEYEQWLAGRDLHKPARLTGQTLYEKLRCGSCHRADAKGTCPTLEGRFGQPVQLADGRTVTADEAYLRESILEPDAKIVAKYPARMPSYQGQLTEEDVFELIAYIKSLGKKDQPPRQP